MNSAGEKNAFGQQAVQSQSALRWAGSADRWKRLPAASWSRRILCFSSSPPMPFFSAGCSNKLDLEVPDFACGEMTPVAIGIECMYG